jgi:hypothetical protein
MMIMKLEEKVRSLEGSIKEKTEENENLKISIE